MRLVQEGPDIPLEILDAQEEGELALFVGAGISFPNDLPSFGGLVEDVREELGASWKPEEKQAYRAKQYDRVLGLLERENRYPNQMRAAVKKQLEVPDEPDLNTHNALIDLARTDYGSGDLHLITTNFDRLFEETDKDYDTASAPRLPVPKRKKWDELVYLHGYISQHDPDGRHLVLTSSDFGVAYLTERWASRFVSELFNHFTVLFVGYSVNDPVIRYLVDAIAADREQGIDERLHEAYAFASYEKESGAEHLREVIERWQTKNITPIPYPAEGSNHEHLHDTLHEWAQLWRGGLKSKKNIVSTYGTKRPAALTEEISQVEWAMSDPPAAREFADLKRKARIEWLSVFEEMGFTNSVVTEERLEAQIPLVDGGVDTDGPQSLSEVTSAVADWLTAHLNKSDLIHWVIRRGGYLHPEFRRKIQSKLAEGGPPRPYRVLWQVLAGSEPFVCSTIGHPFLANRLSSEEWNSGLRSDLLSALTPCLNLQPRSSHFGSLFYETGSDEEGSSQDDPETPSDLARMELEIHSHHPGLLVDRLEDRDDREEVLEDIAFDLFQLLGKAMELFELFGRVGHSEDAIHIQRPSIPSHDQNSDHHGWTILVDLLREAFLVLSEENRSQARNIARFFTTRQYPLFRRFALYGFATSSLPQSATLLNSTLSDSRAWLWSTSIQVELFRALPHLWDALDSKGKTLLADEIIEGPPRDKYKEDISEEEWWRLWDRAVWNRLIRVDHHSEDDLSEAASDLLDEIAERRSNWEYSGEEKEDFPVWTESGWGFETDYSAESLLNRSDEEVVEILTTYEQHREGLLESWRQAVSLDPGQAVRILQMLQENGHYLEEVWKSGFRGFREVEDEEWIHRDVLLQTEQLPDDLLKEVIHPLTALIESVAQSYRDRIGEVILNLWGRLWPFAASVRVRDGSDPLSLAINHPAGKLAEAVFHLLRGRELKQEGGIDSDIHSRIERILENEEEAAQLARVIVASRLALLHFLDSEWTEENVVPLLDWSTSEEARLAWSGYLWSPTMRPDLWPSIKPFFLSTFENLDQLGEKARKSLAVLFVSTATQGEQTLTAEEARRCLRRFDDQGRTEVARWIVRRLEGADERGERLWVERFGPWVDDSWPQEAELRSSQTSVSLSWAAIEAGDAFPSAVSILESRVTSLDRPTHVLDRLDESEHTSSHPEPSLQLLDILIDDISFRHTAEELDRCLEDISASDPSLEDDPRYVRLMELAQQYL